MTTSTPIDRDDIKVLIRSFITRSINIPDLADDDDLFDTGLVNSLFAVQLTTFIEKKFQLDITADDLDIRNFRSLSAATNFVVQKRSGVTA